MLIKEYRIPMPMSVEEYRIAQLYMIQKKSREESCGEGSGVEILENKPYEDGPGGSGQYTHKVYHIGKHIPSWFCAILPQAALRVEEESWNAYPYTRTRYTCPFVEKFSIDIETYYKPDTGNQVDVFNMSSAEKRQRTVDPIDIVKDYIPPHEYLVEEDPKLYQSVKTKRGPLSDDWIEEINQNPGESPVMCAYKLCKVEFRYWGMQSKIERFIHDVGLRKVMVRAHRQAWCWQDEWYGLTIEDIRQLELETQLALAKKMAQYSLNEEGGTETNGSSVSQDQEQEAEAVGSAAEAEGGGGGKLGDSLETRGELTKQWSTSSRSSNRSSKRGGSPSHQSISEWRMQSIARDSEDSTDDEFFDAHEDFSDNEDMFAKEITKWSSNDLMDKIETNEVDEAQETLYQESGGEYTSMSNEERQMEDCSTQQCLQPSKTHVLVLVLHGGNILDTGSGEQNNKQGDVNTLSGAFETVMRVHYPAALGRIAIRMVPCPAVCVDAFSLVSNLSPYSYDESCLSSSQDHIPLAALPLLATSAPQYQDAVATVILRANQVYSDFIKSLEGASFSGQVCVIGDCVGGILGFDALCSSSVTVSESQNSSRRGSAISVQDTDLLSPGIVINSVSPSSPSLEGSRHLSRSNIDIPRCSGPDDPKKQLPRKRSDSSTYELDTIKHHQAFLSRQDLVSALRPACQQVYNLFHPADPSASRLEPLLDKRFYLLPPFSVPRYQRFPLGDGHSALLVDTVQSNPQLLMESAGAASHRCPDSTVNETSIPVPVLNWQLHTETESSHSHIFVDSPHPSSTSPGVPHLRCTRRASEVSIASQVSGLADSYTASNIATTHKRGVSHSKRSRLLSQLALPYNKLASRSPSLRSGKTIRRVFPKPNGMDSEQSSDISSDLTDVTSDISDISSVPPSPRVLKNIEQVASRWWGSKRMDFALYCPDALTAFPTVALPHLFHASYWESTDVVSFLLRQVMRHENSSILELDGKEVSEFTPSKPREKWLRKRTHVKIRTHTHTHTHTKLRLKQLMRVNIRLHLPELTLCSVVLFFCRYWQDLGYLIVYVTGRPDMQKQRVVAWLSQHNFPHGVVSFCDGLVHDPLRHKANFLKCLINEAHMRIFAAYGSTKDISVYTSIGLPPSHIYIVGRPTKKMQNQCQFIPDGYASHLSQLEYNQRSRPAKSASTRMVLRKGSFGLGAAGGDFLRKRNHIFRTISSKQPGGAGSASPNQPGRTERTLSQCEVERDRGVVPATQRSMSIAAGCWGRTGSTKEGSSGLLGPK
uniref:membrane-associated phosphatidylinositol transfer protein 2-like n=1 Tax=Epinephelus lanceolatus TaxID=310571 RepID=UPI001445D488|nr:membrane-associated phosphatidylinositol transfer protein 2-like [Epinephelus lanceolatus]